jgi:hypothetical protein
MTDTISGMSENERRLLIAMAGSVCALLVDRKAESMASEPDTAVGIRFTLHQLLSLMNTICEANQYRNLFTDEQMKAMVS